jgi:hypothetical protein
MSKTTIPTGGITADAITSAKIADNAVVTAGINADAITGAKLADNAINSEHYTDGSIDTAHIGDDQVTAAKATGVGGLALINNTTSASSVSDVVFDNVFTSTYKNYKIIGEYTAVNSSGNTTSRIRFRTGGGSGSNLTASEYNYHFHLQAADSDTTVVKRGTGDSVLDWTTNQDDDSDRHGVRFDFTLFDPHSSGRTTISGHGMNTATDGNVIMFTGACSYKGTDSVTGIDFFVGSGNIKDIAIKIYGIVDS